MALELPGIGSNYAGNVRDSDGNLLYGDKNYKVTLPKDVPAKDFWSLVAYNTQTRSELQTTPKKAWKPGEIQLIK